MATSPCALYAWGAAQALVWRNDLGEVPPGAKQRPPGIIVVDSGACVRGAEHWSVYMQDVLQAVYERTGQRCILVARGGLAFCNHRDPSWTYHHVLQRITARCEAPRFVVWKSLGKDLCPPRADMRAYEPGLRRQRQPRSPRGINILARISILAWISILNEVSPQYAQSVCALHQPRAPVRCNSRREPAGAAWRLIRDYRLI